MITGQITKILTQKDNDWGRFQLSTPDGKTVLAVGIIPGATVGMGAVIDGIEEDRGYGKQFSITSVLSTTADEMAGIRKFFCDGYVKGIGPTKANAIISLFGKQSLDLFDTEEGQIKLQQAKGISGKILENALPSYNENRKYKDIVLFLNGAGTRGQVEAIYEKYGDQALSILKKNPYRLQIDLNGFGFLRADAIAKAAGIKPDSVYRIMAAIKFCIEQAQSQGGHCYLTVDEIREQVAALLVPMPKFEDISERVAENAAKNWPESREKLIKAHNPSMDTLDRLAEAMDTRKIINEGLSDALLQAIEEGVFVNLFGKIYTKQMYELESGIASTLLEMTSEHPVRFVTPECIQKAIHDVEERKTKKMREDGNGQLFTVTNEQRDAVYMALMHRISIISGGPGRGKTAISEIVAHGFMLSGRVYSRDDIIMLAPTGRAAQRITESTGYNAMTAHRAIMTMKQGEPAPNGKLVLVDESSMVDVFLMNSILKYARNCNLIFVGDVDQIASVGPGKVLRDMIDSGRIPFIQLKEGHRNAGTIAHNSELINAGMKIKQYCYDDHFYYQGTTKEQIANLMVDAYINKVNQYGITNVMLCTAMRERGVISVNRMNKMLQEKFTKGHEEAKFGEDKVFRIGDRVMQTKNDYNFVMKREGRNVTGVFNGERGTIVKILPDPEEESYKLVVKFDDGSFGGYTKATVQNLTLAYATTLHKCQGSEAACMIMGYVFSDYILLNKSLFYTGETRAKKEFRFYGEEKEQYGRLVSAFDMAVSRADDAKRNTSLAEMIAQGR